MSILKKEVINDYTNEIRKNMNTIIEEIDGDFTGWCELATMLMFRLIRTRHPNWDNKVVLGYYNGNGHYWNVINGFIVDTTIDQFDEIKPGMISTEYITGYKIKEFINFNEEDLIHMTEDIHDDILLNYV